MSELEDLRAEVDRLRVIINEQKRRPEGPFSMKRGVGRQANLLLADNRRLQAELTALRALCCCGAPELISTFVATARGEGS